MHQLVGEAPGQRFEHRLGVVAAGEHAHRALDFEAPRFLRGFAQLANERHHFARLHPMQERADLGFNDYFGLSDRGLSRVDALAHGRREIIDGVEKYVVHLRPLGFDIPAHAAIETTLAPIPVLLRTSFATAKERWKSLLRSVPRVPADSATRTASFICPRICGSPTTMESRPEATRNACRTASPCGRVYR